MFERLILHVIKKWEGLCKTISGYILFNEKFNSSDI